MSLCASWYKVNYNFSAVTPSTDQEALSGLPPQNPKVDLIHSGYREGTPMDVRTLADCGTLGRLSPLLGPPFPIQNNERLGLDPTAPITEAERGGMAEWLGGWRLPAYNPSSAPSLAMQP